MNIRLPASWKQSQAWDFLQIDAGAAYVASQIDKDYGPTPEHIFELTSDRNSDYCAYEIFDDGSLWFVNNAQDEVWSDYRDFVTNQLLPGAAALNSDGKLVWEESDNREWDGHVLNSGDRQILTLYCDGDEEAAKELVGLSTASAE